MEMCPRNLQQSEMKQILNAQHSPGRSLQRRCALDRSLKSVTIIAIKGQSTRVDYQVTPPTSPSNRNWSSPVRGSTFQAWLDLPNIQLGSDSDQEQAQSEIFSQISFRMKFYWERACTQPPTILAWEKPEVDRRASPTSASNQVAQKLTVQSHKAKTLGCKIEPEVELIVNCLMHQRKIKSSMSIQRMLLRFHPCQSTFRYRNSWTSKVRRKLYP